MRLLLLSLCLGLPLPATTLEKLSIEQMSQKATSILRGRVGNCRAGFRGATIYTACSLSVLERWKGAAVSEVSTPGGTAQGLSQSFSGSPALIPGQEYVLFLWTGRNGMTQLIGLSQGVFDIGTKPDGKTAQREVSAALMVDASGREVENARVEMTVDRLRQRVASALRSEK